MGYANTLKIINHTIDAWVDGVIAFIPNLIMAGVILGICGLGSKTVRNLAWKIFNRNFPNHTDYLTIFNIIVTSIFWFFGVFLVLNILHLTAFLTHLLAGAGIVGIVAGFALNDVSSNAFAGLLIRTQRPFVVGDWVKIGEFFGTVDKIGLVGTYIQTYQGHLAYVPNQLMFSNSFLNYSTYGKVKIIVPIGVSYGDDLAHVERVALDTIEKLPMIIHSELRDFYFVNVGASTYNFQVRFWVEFKQHIDILTAESEAIKALKKAFEKENISVAYNVMTLDFGVKGGVNLYDNPIAITEDGNGAKLNKLANVTNETQELPPTYMEQDVKPYMPPCNIPVNRDGTIILEDVLGSEANRSFIAEKLGHQENSASNQEPSNLQLQK